MASDRTEYPKLLAGLWRHLTSRRKKQLSLLLVLMIISTVFELVSVGTVLPFLMFLLNPEKAIADARWLSILPDDVQISIASLQLIFTSCFVAAVLVSGATRLAQILAHAKLSHAIGADISVEIYRRTLYQPYIVHTRRNTSEILSAIIEKSDTVVAHTIMPILTMMSGAFTLFSAFILVAYINILVAIAILVTYGLLYGGVILTTKNKILSHGKMIDVEQGKVIKILQEGLGGIRETILDSAQSQNASAYQKVVRPLRSALASIHIIGASPRILVDTLSIVALSVAAYAYAKGQTAAFQDMLPVIGMLVLGIQRLLPVIQQSYAALTLIQGSRSTLASINALLDQPLPELGRAVEMFPFEKAISIHGLSYRFSAEMPWVLKDVSIDIAKGERVGIIGKTGSGKSTLIDLIMGLLHDDGGAIRIDGRPLTQANSPGWHQCIAHVPQSIFLLDASIAENIAYGMAGTNVDMLRVEEAARLARLDDFVSTLPDGYATTVGDRGIRLSGGQRQRIGIARALYKRAALLILDEATSALDSNTEAEIMSFLDDSDKNLTVIIIAHRLTTLRGCDKIVELARGKVVRIGSYDQIIPGANKA